MQIYTEKSIRKPLACVAGVVVCCVFFMENRPLLKKQNMAENKTSKTINKFKNKETPTHRLVF